MGILVMIWGNSKQNHHSCRELDNALNGLMDVITSITRIVQVCEITGHNYGISKGMENQVLDHQMSSSVIFPVKARTLDQENEGAQYDSSR